MIIDVTGFGRGSLKKGFGCICIVAVVCVMSHRLLLVKKGESETIWTIILIKAMSDDQWGWWGMVGWQRLVVMSLLSSMHKWGCSVEIEMTDASRGTSKIPLTSNGLKQSKITAMA